MTCSRSSLHSSRGKASGLLLLAALCGVAGTAAAQDAGTRYARAVADAAISQRYNAYLEGQLRSQEREIAALEQQLAGMDATASDVQPMLQQMFDDLEKFVAADVPFLQDERSARIERLRDLMGQADATASEKFRRLIEAYQVEMEYGRTMDSYARQLDGKPADFVRLGRVSLLYKTQDGKTGYWDNQKKSWVEDLDDARAINDALRIAKGEGAPDLIIVPVPAPQGGGS